MFDSLANKALNRAKAKYNDRLLSEVNPEGKAHKPAFYAGDGQSLVLGEEPVEKPIITNGSIKIGDPIIDRGFSIYATPRIKKPVIEEPVIPETKINIKYLYRITQEGEDRLYVGGHQKQSVRITPIEVGSVFDGAAFTVLDGIMIDNKAGDDFEVTLRHQAQWTDGTGPISDGGRLRRRYHYEMVTKDTKETIVKVKDLLALDGNFESFSRGTLTPVNDLIVGEQTSLNTSANPYHYCGHGLFTPFDPFISGGPQGMHYLGSDGYWYAQTSYQSGDLLRSFWFDQTFTTTFFTQTIEGITQQDYMKMVIPGKARGFENPFLFNINFGFENVEDVKRMALCKVSRDGRSMIGLYADGINANYNFFVAQNNSLTFCPPEFKVINGYAPLIARVWTKFDWHSESKFTALNCREAVTSLYERFFANDRSSKVPIEYKIFNTNNLGFAETKTTKVFPIDQEGEVLAILSFGVYLAS